jgi:2'-5' RNA ligase
MTMGIVDRQAKMAMETNKQSPTAQTDDQVVESYVALNVLFTPPISAIQADMTRRLLLIPRKEIHITFGFLGTVSLGTLRLISSELTEFVDRSLHTVNVQGIGGAFQIGERPQHITHQSIAEALQWPRVIWLAIEPDAKLARFREAVISQVAKNKITAARISKTFYPHITLGSSGPEGNDWSLWDVHTLPKVPTMNWETPIPVAHCDKAHVTCVEKSPETICLIRAFKECTDQQSYAS